MKPTICLRSGIEFDLENPKPEMIKLSDILHTLPYIIRFGAHCEPTVSVGCHTVLVYELLLEMGVDKPTLLKGLLHDSPEAYVGDVPAPLKMLLPDYKVIEKRVAGVISEALDVDIVNLPKEVKDADLKARQIEQFHLMPDTDWWRKHHVGGWTMFGIPKFFNDKPFMIRHILAMRLRENKPEWANLTRPFELFTPL